MNLSFPMRILEETSKSDDKSYISLKIISLFVILIIGVIFGLLPYFIKSCRKNVDCLSLVNTFGGGLFLGIGLFHILPETNEKFEKYEKLKDVPLSYFLAFISYALILFVERVAFDGHSLIKNHEHDHKNNHEDNDEKKDKKKEIKKKIVKDNQTPIETENVMLNQLNNKKEKEKNKVKNNKEEKKEEENNTNTSKISFKRILNSIFLESSFSEQLNRSVEQTPIVIYSKKNNTFISKHKIQKIKNPIKKIKSVPGLTLEEMYEKKNRYSIFQNLFTPFVLLFALGFHGIFEGLALGIEDRKNEILFLLLAISAHKWAASLSLGISFIKAKTSKKIYIIMTMIFAIIGPIGILLGIILSKTANDLVEGILMGISVGTFIYVACSDILVEEFENRKNRFLKFFLFIAGGVFCAGLSFVEIYGEKNED